MSYVVSTASKSPFVKPKKSIHSENVVNSGCCTPPPEPPRELEGFRIPLVESRVLSPTPRAPPES